MTFSSAALIGCPDDRGVANNGGRPGASEGPACFRKWFQKPKGANPVQSLVQDYGNVAPSDSNIKDTHEKVAALIHKAHDHYDGTLVVGGGHDYAYAHLRGLSGRMKDHQRLGCINIDPHFDMRSYDNAILSGSPFYMALEEAVIQGPNLVPFGIQHFCNGGPLWQYAQQNQVPFYTRESMRFSGLFDNFTQVLETLSHQCDQIVISLDLDAINMAYAPAVSAPNIEGFSPSEILAMLEIAAGYSAVQSLGIYELNPGYDQDAHTARLAVTAAFTFLDHKLNN